jgi:ureidoacrylate peracid hydrolase
VTSVGPTITVDAKPEPLALEVGRAAVLVVDMQNDFGAEGGLLARAGIDISGIRAAVAPTARVLGAARRAGIPVVYLQMGLRPDLADAGAPDGRNGLTNRLFRVGAEVVAPDGTTGRLLVRDTWNTAILAELAPEPGDVALYKHRYSGFYETELDAVLRRRGVTDLIVTGCTTSVCVESTVRDAAFRDYRCLLLADCTAEPIGDDLPRTNHEASLLVVERVFGWVSTSSDLVAALERQPVAISR